MALDETKSWSFDPRPDAATGNSDDNLVDINALGSWDLGYVGQLANE